MILGHELKALDVMNNLGFSTCYEQLRVVDEMNDLSSYELKTINVMNKLRLCYVQLRVVDDMNGFGIVDDMNDSRSFAQGSRCDEQVKVVNDMNDSRCDEQVRAMDDLNDSRSYAQGSRCYEQLKALKVVVSTNDLGSHELKALDVVNSSRLSQQSNALNGVQFGVETKKLQPLQANHSKLKEAFCKVMRNHPFVAKRFIKGFSSLSKPLCELLAKDAKFIWDERCQHSFDQLKKFLTTTPIVRAPNWQLPFELMCDASDFAIGAVLGQREDGKPYVIYYASKTLNEAQRNYTTTEKELLVVVFALDKF
ncbi:hypothetical protein AAG906_027279 [Vitis piasezkii]